MAELVVALEAVGLEAIGEVGGKNASLGEMIRQLSAQGVRVPGGFATTAAASTSTAPPVVAVFPTGSGP